MSACLSTDSRCALTRQSARTPKGISPLRRALPRSPVISNVSRHKDARHSVLLLNQGQRPLLEFLRNLTPQVLLASTALLLWVRLDFRRFDPANWPSTSAFFLCLALLLLAFFANMNQFLDALLESLNPYARVARRLRKRGVGPNAAACGSLRVMLRQRPTLFLDLVVSVAIINIALIAISFAALSAAKAALR